MASFGVLQEPRMAATDKEEKRNIVERKWTEIYREELDLFEKGNGRLIAVMIRLRIQ